MTTPWLIACKVWLNSFPLFEIDSVSWAMSALPPSALDDPRQQGWPCNGQRKQGRQRANQYASWSTCSKCGLRISYVVKGSHTGYTRQMGPELHVVTLAMQELQEETSAAECTEKMVNGKIMEVKGKLLQLGLEHRQAIQLTFKEYTEKMEKGTRQAKMGLATPGDSPLKSAKATSQPSAQLTPDQLAMARQLEQENMELRARLVEAEKTASNMVELAQKAKAKSSPVKREKATVIKDSKDKQAKGSPQSTFTIESSDEEDQKKTEGAVLEG